MSFLEKYKIQNNRKYSIVLLGELLIDEILSSDSTKSITVFGGSPANITMNLKKIGIQPLLFSAIGNDSDGNLLLDCLEKNKVDTKYINVTNSKTSRVMINSSTDSPKPQFFRDSDYHINYSKELNKVIGNTKILHLSYWPLSEEPSLSTSLKVIEDALSNDVIIGFDPNYHVDLVTKNSISTKDLKNLISKVNIIKPSLDDSIRIFGPNFTIEEYLNKFRELGCDLVIMTLGKEGVIASYKGEVMKLPSVAKNVVDATGAGDAFWSGLYAGIINNEKLIDAMKIGLACSAYNLLNVGAYSLIPSFEIIKEKYNI